MECNEESMAAATRYKFRDGFEELLKAQPESTDVDVLISEVATEVPKLAFLDCVEDMYEDAHQAKITASLLFGGVKNLPDA